MRHQIWWSRYCNDWPYLSSLALLSPVKKTSSLLPNRLFPAIPNNSGLLDFQPQLGLSWSSRSFKVAAEVCLLCGTLFASLCHTRHAVVHVPERPTASWAHTRFPLAERAPKSGLFTPSSALIGCGGRSSPHGAQMSRCSMPAPQADVTGAMFEAAYRPM